MKILLIIVGSLSLILGIIGVIVPLLPTTPFLLLAAILYAHSSPRLYSWLLSHKLFGSYIRNYREHRAMSRSLKCVIIATLWLTILISIFSIPDHTIWIDILLLVIAIAVTWHIASLGHKSK